MVIAGHPVFLESLCYATEYRIRFNCCTAGETKDDTFPWQLPLRYCWRCISGGSGDRFRWLGIF